MAYLNAHCHLELSFLQGKIPPGLPFAHWLERVVAARRGLTTHEAKDAAARFAVNELQNMIQDDTRVLLDIDSLGFHVNAKEFPSLKLIRYQELICFRPEHARSILTHANSRQAAHGSCFSPHSPYTVCEPLLALLGNNRASQNLCIHLAETQEEADFTTTGTGPLREFFESIGALPPGWKAPGRRPVEVLERQKLLTPRTLLVHCNHLTEFERHLIAQRGCSVVVCPGTHVYFERNEFPLKRLKDAGIPVYLGTDSLASNAELSMKREIELACQLSPGVNTEWIAGLASAERNLKFLG